MKLGVIADIHGNEVALRAVLGDAARCQVDRWWVLTGRREQLQAPSLAAP
jgi:hypothetical protein